MSTIAERRARWTTPEGAERARTLVERLRAGEDVTDLAFGEIEGRLDFRGLTLGDLRVEGATLRGWDVRHGRIENTSFDRCALHDCRFDRAFLGPPGFYRSSVERCSFLGASLDLSLGIPWEPACRFRDTTFERANLYRTSAAGVFEDCDFNRARAIRTEFSGSRLVRCSFRDAELSDATFGHGETFDGLLDDCDFSGAVMHHSRVLGLDVATCAPPDRTEAIFVAPLETVCLRGLETLEREPGEIAHDLLEGLARQLEEMRPGQTSGCVATGSAEAADRVDAIARDRALPARAERDVSPLPRRLRRMFRDLEQRPPATPAALEALRSYDPVPDDLAELVAASDGLTGRLKDGGAFVHLWPVEAWAVRRRDLGLHRQPPERAPIGTVNGRYVGVGLARMRPMVLKMSFFDGSAEALGGSLAEALPRIARTPRL